MRINTYPKYRFVEGGNHTILLIHEVVVYGVDLEKFHQGKDWCDLMMDAGVPGAAIGIEANISQLSSLNGYRIVYFIDDLMHYYVTDDGQPLNPCDNPNLGLTMMDFKLIENFGERLFKSF